jgi:prepilin-type N-terminal cleavage/methylation domain-containing protein
MIPSRRQNPFSPVPCYGKVGKRRAAGFTLIEMLVALAMVVVIAASLVSTLWTAYHAVRQADANIAPVDQACTALDIVSDDLANALQQSPGAATANANPLIGMSNAANNYETTAFLGTQEQGNNGQAADDVVFFTTSESPVHTSANGEIKCVEYKVVQPTGSSDLVLVRRVTRNLLPSTGQTGSIDEQVVCRGVYEFVVQYSPSGAFPPSTDLTSDRAWDASQQTDPVIPAAVRITLVLNQTQPNGRTVAGTTFSRVVMLPCSSAALDTNVNTGMPG